MSFPNLTDIVATTIERRSPDVADSVTKNNAVLTWLEANGQMQTFDGGRTIYEPLSFAENANGGSYSGADTLPVAAADVISGAEFAIKQYAVPVTITGLEEIQNSGREALIKLLEARMKVAEGTMKNLISQGIYSDGTGNGGKDITGLGAAVPTDPTTGTYGGINRANWTFWQSQLTDTQTSATTIQSIMDLLWAKCVRGSDHPDLIVMGSTEWGQFLSSMQTIQRFTDPKKAELGFTTMRYMMADVVLDGGIGGQETATVVHMLNTNFLHFKTHSARNFTKLDKRFAVNQDASVSILAWAGNLTCSGAQFQGKLTGD